MNQPKNSKKKPLSVFFKNQNSGSLRLYGVPARFKIFYYHNKKYYIENTLGLLCFSFYTFSMFNYYGGNPIFRHIDCIGKIRNLRKKKYERKIEHLVSQGIYGAILNNEFTNRIMLNKAQTFMIVQDMQYAAQTI